MNWSSRMSLKKVEHYTRFLHRLGVFNEVEKKEILDKIHQYKQKKTV
ncbi:hypothetical protein LCY76_08555 [Fictibacillus sp. KIGAM418]|uniref:Uncharacterized protein n=1 Tax=Fictibacillus marinisediminis TaxID=2878389 RepID=A0A9X1XC09_9BACL|nr:hypothetical protein [Fictibacillus marinisediminis]MCK6256643.1 hypothetical protein [Fictibacillus marinisediminis]